MTEIIRPRVLPWLRTGLAAHIAAKVVDGMAPAATASITVAVQLRSTGSADDGVDAIPSPPIDLLGPGHVVGLDPAVIVRRDPLPDADDAEPNYFTTVELASADLPWRFTPAATANEEDNRLQPWLVLVVVEDRPGVTLDAGTFGRLDVLGIDAADGELPDLAESWAWAHVHADDELVDTPAAAFAARPENFRSRLMCPRRLTPNTPWIAALVPAFEAGRASGLGRAANPGRLVAWEVTDTDVVLPVYSSWRFRTGPRGDFESLVTRLTPRELPADVGRRALDLSAAGGGLPTAAGATTTFTGALVSPAPSPQHLPDAVLADIEGELTTLLNAAAQRERAIPADYEAVRDDPVVGPTIYAARQAGERRVPTLGEEPVWFGQLNVEPHHRAAAGLGAEIVRRDQEALMGAAWEQAGAMRPVNDLLRSARAAWEVAGVTQARTLALSDDSLMQIAAPAAARLRLDDGTTMFSAIEVAGIPRGLLSAAFRRRCAAVPSLAARPPSGPRVAPTRAITSACLDSPVEFTATWTTSRLAADAGALDPVSQESALHLIEREAMDVPETRYPTVGPMEASDTAPDRFDEDRNGGLVVGRAVVSTTVSLETALRRSLDPRSTIAAMLTARVDGLDAERDHQAPARLTARPQFTTPMYSRLVELNPEYLVPGIGAVPTDTVALLEVHRPFIEAFFGGLNHEMGREFVWREYPARLDATWFQQFWNSFDGAADILPIGAWDQDAGLGANPPLTTTPASLVLLVTGTLLRRYPDTKVYAVEAEWVDHGRFEMPDGDVRLPVFSGNLGPSTRFFGFDLDQTTARGSTIEPQRAGYYFVLEEQPHAPRFGLDPARASHRGKAPNAWSSMSWAHLAPIGDDPLPDFVHLDAAPWLTGVEREGNGGPDVWAQDAAAMARITLQRPVRMLVHADSMLPAPPPPIVVTIEPPGPSGPIGRLHEEVAP